MSKLMRKTIAIIMLAIITTSFVACAEKKDASENNASVKDEEGSKSDVKPNKVKVVSKQTETYNGNKNVTEYKYNKYGEVTEEKILMEQYNSERVVTYVYNELGNKIEISNTTKDLNGLNPDYTYVRTFEYDDNNLVKCEEDGSLLEEYTYNDDGTLKSKIEVRGGTIFEQKYEYDENGNLVKMEERMESVEEPTLVEEYSYNSDGTLLCITGVVGNIGPYKKEYDKNGNCLKYEIYDENKKEVISLEEYNYNENGDMTRRQYFTKGWGLSKDELGIVEDTLYEYNGDELYKMIDTHYELSCDDNKEVIDVYTADTEYVYEYEYKEIEVEER